MGILNQIGKIGEKKDFNKKANIGEQYNMALYSAIMAMDQLECPVKRAILEARPLGEKEIKILEEEIENEEKSMLNSSIGLSPEINEFMSKIQGNELTEEDLAGNNPRTKIFSQTEIDGLLDVILDVPNLYDSGKNEKLQTGKESDIEILRKTNNSRKNKNYSNSKSQKGIRYRDDSPLV